MKTMNQRFKGSEYQLYDAIIRALYPVCVLHRTNVTVRKNITVPRISPDGRVQQDDKGRILCDSVPVIMRTGLPNGYPDLSGHRKTDGKAVYIECKVGYNKPTEDQIKFLVKRREEGCIAGICRSVQDALDLVTERGGMPPCQAES